MKVIFKHKNGRTQVMHVRYAKILSNLGKGDFDHGEGLRAELSTPVSKLPGDLAFPGTDDTRTVEQVQAQIKADNAALLNQTPAADEIKASKAAKALAESAGVDIRNITGTGDGGAITKPDVQAFIDAQAKE